MALDFPNSPTNGQQYTLNGVTYYYDATQSAWLTTYVTSFSFDNVGENQVVFVNSNQANGSLGLTYDRTDSRLFANNANIGGLNVSGVTVISNTVTVTGNTTLANVRVSGNLSIARVNTAANNSFGTSGQVLTSNGSGNVYWSTISAAGSLLSRNVYTSTQTITIPTGATAADVTMVGAGGGGQNYVGGCAFTAGNGGGAGGALSKLLTGLTAGLTLSLTIGSGGGAGANGSSDTILASGTQSITTLTAAKGIRGDLNGAGGSGTNGDINITGRGGGQQVGNLSGAGGSPGFGLGVGGDGHAVTSPGLSGASGYGAGGAGGGEVSTGGGSGTNGICIITWYR